MPSEVSVFRERTRWKQVANFGSTTETTIYVGGILEVLMRGSLTEYRHLAAPGVRGHSGNDTGLPPWVRPRQAGRGVNPVAFPKLGPRLS